MSELGKHYPPTGNCALEMQVTRIRKEMRAGRKADTLIMQLFASVRQRAIQMFSRLCPVCGMDDLLGEARLRLLRDWMSLEHSERFWEINFSTCFERVILDTARFYERLENDKRRDRPELPDGNDWLDCVPGRLPSVEQEAYEHMLMDGIEEALTDREWRAFVMFFMEEHHQAEIAKPLEVTDRTVRHYLSRAREKARPVAERFALGVPA